MAEAGSFAERVKQQADIVRVIGEYVRLKKTGQNFTGLCPFHQEKTPSFAVHPVQADLSLLRLRRGRRRFQIRDGNGEVHVSRKRCAPSRKSAASRFRKPRERSPEERKRKSAALRAGGNASRSGGIFCAAACTRAPEGKVAMAYLEDRGLNREAMTRFGLGFAPSAGDALLAFPETEISGKTARSLRASSRATRAGDFTIASAAASCFRFRMKPGK